METAEIIKDPKVSKNGLKVEKNGNFITTYNKRGQVIHKMDLGNVPDRIMVHEWIGYRTDDEFREICEGHFFDNLRKNGITKVLVNIANMTGSFDGVNDWMATSFMPKLVSMGFKASAVVLPKDIFAKISAENWIKNNSGFENGNFGSVENAMNWLKSKK